jgi:anti-sigma B factor antagonist
VSRGDFSVVVAVDGSPTVPRVTIAGELDLASVDQVRMAVEPLAGPGVACLELDLAAVEFLDSSGLAVFIELARCHRLRIVAASNPVRRIITVTGLDEVLGLDP